MLIPVPWEVKDALISAHAQTSGTDLGQEQPENLSTEVFRLLGQDLFQITAHALTSPASRMRISSHNVQISVLKYA